MEMQKLFDQFVRERQFLTNVTEKTLVYYQTAWRKWQPHLVQVHSEAELRPATRAAITELSASGKICARSINTYICVLQRSEEHTSELQSLRHLVCRLL